MPGAGQLIRHDSDSKIHDAGPAQTKATGSLQVSLAYLQEDAYKRAGFYAWPLEFSKR
jgi:hypothetical protein